MLESGQAMAGLAGAVPLALNLQVQYKETEKEKPFNLFNQSLYHTTGY